MPTITSRPVHVRVPATSANLGPGFDALGLALGLVDEVRAHVVSDGLQVDVVGEGVGFVARDDRNLVVRAMRATFAELGEGSPGLALTCRNAIPHSRGLGSSAAAIVAGVLAARALVAHGTQRLADDDVLALAARIEGHPDNVAACLLGGLTISWYDDGRARAIRLEPVEQLSICLLVPDTWSSTPAARSALPATVPHRDASFNAGRAALLVAALTQNPELLLCATADRLHQQYRRDGMPDSVALVDRLRRNGIAAAISGAGPTVIAFPVGRSTLAALVPEGFHVRTLPVDRQGATVR